MFDPKKRMQQAMPGLKIKAPQFPGQQLKDLSDNQVRALIKEQRRMKGFQHAVQPGTPDFDLQISGTARILLGLSILPQAYLDPEDPAGALSNPFPYITGFRNIKNVTLKVNNETIIENVHPDFLGNFINKEEYIYLPRPLSGTDQIVLTYTNDRAETEISNVIIYYI